MSYINLKLSFELSLCQLMYPGSDMPFVLLSLLSSFLPRTSFYFLVFLHYVSDLCFFFIFSSSLGEIRDSPGKTRIL